MAVNNDAMISGCLHSLFIFSLLLSDVLDINSIGVISVASELILN